MQLVSVNIGAAKAIAAKSGQSGIYKEPVEKAWVSSLGVEGDTIVDTAHHGGRDQAVYAYTIEDYAWWSETLGRRLNPGTFGENLTFDRWPSDIICVGDRVILGDVVLEVTSPRIPCVTLDARMGIKGFVRAFHDARRPGPYFRVISGGRVAAGQDIIVQPFKPMRKRLVDWPGLFARPLQTMSEIDAWLATPVHYKMRADLETARNG